MGDLGPWEDEAVAWFALRAKSKRDLCDQEGSVFITFDGQEAQVYDELVHLIPTLCFDAVTAVLKKGTVEFMLDAALTAVELSRQGSASWSLRFFRTATREGPAWKRASASLRR